MDDDVRSRQCGSGRPMVVAHFVSPRCLVRVYQRVSCDIPAPRAFRLSRAASWTQGFRPLHRGARRGSGSRRVATEHSPGSQTAIAELTAAPITDVRRRPLPWRRSAASSVRLMCKYSARTDAIGRLALCGEDRPAHWAARSGATRVGLYSQVLFGRVRVEARTDTHVSALRD